MPGDCSDGCTQTQQDALAELSFEVGVSLSMDYGFCGSGAHTTSIPHALESYFRYDPDVEYLVPTDEDALIREIMWLRPFVLSGRYLGDQEGHSWVVHGYSVSPYQYWMNLGWGGIDDGWYELDEIFPIDSVVVRFIAPEVVKFADYWTFFPGNGSPDSPYWGIQGAHLHAPDGATVIFPAGTVQPFSASPLVLDRPMTLRGWDVTFQYGER